MKSKKIAASELLLNADGSIYHLNLRPEELADTVILVGDPGRVSLIAKHMTAIEFTKQSREFVSTTGMYNGKRITVLSTGIGTDNIDIVMNELDAIANIDFNTREIKKEKRSLTLVRIGTSGALQPEIPLGSFVLSHVSIGCDGLVNWYANRDSVTDKEMENALVKHMNWDKNLPRPYLIKNSERLIKLFEKKTIKGMTISAPGFFGPQGRVLRLQLAMPDMNAKFESFRSKDYKITNYEMEGSAIAGLAKEMGHEAITVCCIIANRYRKEAITDYHPYIEKLILLVLDTLTGKKKAETKAVMKAERKAAKKAEKKAAKKGVNKKVGGKKPVIKKVVSKQAAKKVAVKKALRKK